MRYTELLAIAGNDAEEAHGIARTALIPYIKGSAKDVRARIAKIPVFRSYPELLSVPRRVLKRWGTRAALTGIPRSGLLKGPRLAMHRANVLTRSVRGFMP